MDDNKNPVTASNCPPLSQV